MVRIPLKRGLLLLTPRSTQICNHCSNDIWQLHDLPRDQETVLPGTSVHASGLIGSHQVLCPSGQPCQASAARRTNFTPPPPLPPPPPVTPSQPCRWRAPWRDFVAERLADLRDSKRNFLAHDVDHLATHKTVWSGVIAAPCTMHCRSLHHGPMAPWPPGPRAPWPHGLLVVHENPLRPQEHVSWETQPWAPRPLPRSWAVSGRK